MWAGIALDLRHVRSLYIRHIRQLVKLAKWTNHSLTVLYDGLYRGYLYISSVNCNLLYRVFIDCFVLLGN